VTVAAPVETMTQAVECVDLSYQFATHLAVDHVNLSIAPGEMYGLLGPNGAGKTTTIRMITTLLTPGTGSVRVFGLDAAARPMLVRRVIGYVPQALSADANLTGVENVELFARHPAPAASLNRRTPPTASLSRLCDISREPDATLAPWCAKAVDHGRLVSEEGASGKRRSPEMSRVSGSFIYMIMNVLPS
jgi:ABC-type uncharacterized transport system ATPase subunit